MHLRLPRPNRSLIFALFVSLGLAAGTVGCSSPDDSEAEEDTGSEAMDTGPSIDGDLPDDFSFASEYRMRFTQFAFTEDSPGTVANSIIEDFLDQSLEYPIVVLLHIKDINPEEGTAKLRAGAGLKVDMSCVPQGDEECDYEWDPDGNFTAGGGIGEIENCADRIGEGDFPSSDAGGTGDAGSSGDGGETGTTDAGGGGGNGSSDEYADIQIDADTGELTGALEQLDFIGTTQFEDGSIEKFTLPINNLIFKDAFIRPTGDGEVEVRAGRIRGYITEKDAKENEVRLNQGGDPVPIANVITDPLNYDANGDGTLDSWCMEATFTAGETNIVE